MTRATRSQAEADAINLLAGAKTQSNPENSVGVLSLAGKVPRVLVTPTDDLGVVLNAVHGVSIEGTVNFPTGVQVRLSFRKIPTEARRERSDPSATTQIQDTESAHRSVWFSLRSTRRRDRRAREPR